MDPESALLARAKKGDAPAFERLLAPHLPMLFAYSRAICGDYHSAQDVVQETAVIAFRNLEHLFPEVDFSTWLRAIARRQALQARRQTRRLAPFSEKALEVAYQDPAPPSVTLRRKALTECIGALGDRVQAVVQDHYFQGARLTDVASRLNTSVAAVKQLLYRARRLLEECLRKRLGTEQVT